MFDFFEIIALENGYARREKQYDMAEEVLKAIQTDDHLLVEAGVGIGKTFAYLVPSLLFSELTQSPIIIATSTITLQEQLMKDIKEIMKLLGIHVNPVMAKGQTHYICTEKAREYAGPGSMMIKKALESGCLERSEFEVDDSIWEKVRVDHYTHKCWRSCKNPCAYHKLRTDLPKAKLTICNHNLLTMHRLHMAQNQPAILNRDAQINIIDEAHNLESKIRECTQIEITQKRLNIIIRDSLNSVPSRDRYKAERSSEDALKITQRFFHDIERQVREQDYQNEDAIERYYYSNDKKLLQRLMNALYDFNLNIDIYSDWKSSNSSVQELQNIIDSLQVLVYDTSNHVIWLEKSGTFCFCKISMAGLSRRLYIDDNPTCIFTSATLTGTSIGPLSEQYSYVSKGLGFEGFFSEPKESPFNYDEHAMVFYAEDLPHPTRERDDFIKEGTKLLKKILRVSEGRALVLFTAKKDMLEVYEELKQDSPYEILMQRPGSSQQETLDAFKNDEHAVLLGTGAYWEGISVEGKTLSNVIIFRLPFPVPDPILDSRQRIAKDPLMDVLVPEMVIKLKQGVGRLIRSEMDKGIISIIDSRISDKSNVPYKETVWSALPIKNKTSSIEEIQKFYIEVVEKF